MLCSRYLCFRWNRIASMHRRQATFDLYMEVCIRPIPSCPPFLCFLNCSRFMQGTVSFPFIDFIHSAH